MLVTMIIKEEKTINLRPGVIGMVCGRVARRGIEGEKRGKEVIKFCINKKIHKITYA